MLVMIDLYVTDPSSGIRGTRNIKAKNYIIYTLRMYLFSVFRFCIAVMKLIIVPSLQPTTISKPCSHHNLFRHKSSVFTSAVHISQDQKSHSAPCQDLNTYWSAFSEFLPRADTYEGVRLWIMVSGADFSWIQGTSPIHIKIQSRIKKLFGTRVEDF